MIGRIFTIKKESKQLPPSLFYCCNYLLRARKSSRGGKRARISELLLSIPPNISSCPWEGKAQGRKGGSRRPLLGTAFSRVNAQWWPQPGCSPHPIPSHPGDSSPKGTSSQKPTPGSSFPSFFKGHRASRLYSRRVLQGASGHSIVSLGWLSFHITNMGTFPILPSPAEPEETQFSTRKRKKRGKQPLRGQGRARAPSRVCHRASRFLQKSGNSRKKAPVLESTCQPRKPRSTQTQRKARRTC